MTDRAVLLDAVDSRALAAALDSSAPELGAAAGLESLGFGFYSFVFRTGGGWIVRVARTPETTGRHLRECEVLPKLTPFLPVAIPQPRSVLGPCSATPFGAIAYPALPGRVMTEEDGLGEAGERIAHELAEALAALHTVPRESVPESVPAADPGHLQRLWSTVAPALEARLDPHDWARVHEWWQGLLASDIPSYPRRTLVHGDPWWQNLMVDETGLVGILDWEYLSWSDPANDLGVTLHMGEPFFATVLARYQALSPRDDPALEHRARQLAASRAFYGFEFAIVREDDGEWEDSMQSLRAGPILRS